MNIITKITMSVRGILYKILYFRVITGNGRLLIGKDVTINYSLKELKVEGHSTIKKGALIQGGGKIRFSGNNSVSGGVVINCEKGAELIIGLNSYLSNYSVIGAINRVEIGSNVMVGFGTLITDSSYDFEKYDKPIRDQGLKSDPVTIEDDVWIGANCTITSGVTIGRSTIIGANSVVTKDIPPYSIAVGVPCKVIKKRK